MTRLGTWSWSIENPNCVCAQLFVQILWTVVPTIRNSCAQSFTCLSCLIICAHLLWTLLRLFFFSVLNYSHHASSMHFDKLIYLQVGILQASPIYNENLYSLSVHTSFVTSANAYLVHMVAVRSGDLGQVLVQPSNNQTLSPMHWWGLVWPLMAGAAAFCKSALCPRLGSAIVGIRCWSNLGHLLCDVYVGWSYIVFNKKIQPDFSLKLIYKICI